jgi:hypothetical protein
VADQVAELKPLHSKLAEMAEQFPHLLRNFAIYSLNLLMTGGKKWQIYLQAFPAPIQSKPSESETK